MGGPEFKIRELIRREKVEVFSSNYALYGDLSRRVGDSLHSLVPTVESYSIDESFLNLGEFNSREVEPLARELRDRVKQWVGIPTCVGIAPTKTLAKVANFIAKKRPQYDGVCDLSPCAGSCCPRCRWKRSGASAEPRPPSSRSLDPDGCGPGRVRTG